jgi:hypothetical protein
MAPPLYPPLPSPSPLELSAQAFADPPPAALVRAVLWLRRTLFGLAKALGPAELCVVEDATAAVLLHVLAALIRSGVPEALAARPLTAEDLAQQTGLNPDAVFRTLRCAALHGYFRLRQDGHFEHSARSRALLGGRPSRIRELLLYFGSGSNQAAWAHFGHALQTGRSPFEHVHGVSVWEWFEGRADEREMFADAMLGLSVGDAPVIARLYPFGEVQSLCDIGGGRGTLLSELLVRYPHLQGVLYESPHVLESARPLLAARGVLERVQLTPGSFFESIPGGAQAYLLKNILHDWDDERCVAILRNVRAAMSPGARLLIAEALVERHSRNAMGVATDLQMMVACSGGRERGLSDFEALLGQAAFRLARVSSYPTISLLEALPG